MIVGAFHILPAWEYMHVMSSQKKIQHPWCILGGRQETGSFSGRMRSLMFSIYVRPFGLFFWKVKQEEWYEQKLCEIFTVSRSHIGARFQQRKWEHNSFQQGEKQNALKIYLPWQKKEREWTLEITEWSNFKDLAQGSIVRVLRYHMCTPRYH